MSYRLASAELFVVKIPFRFRFQHAAAQRGHNDTVFIKVTTECGRIGWGETLTRPYLTGETPMTVTADVTSWWPELQKLVFDGSDPEEVLSPLQIAADRVGKNAAWSLVDIALYDLWLRNLPTQNRESNYATLVTMPVGLGNVGAILPYLGHLGGFERFKFKVDQQWNAIDIRLAAASKLPAVLAVDANMSLPMDRIKPLAAWLKARGIRYIEQPFLSADDASSAALVRENVAIVIADESLCSLADAERIIRARAAGGFNVRLAKLGGITGSRAMMRKARLHGLKVQLGALVGETDLLSNAARFCLSAFEPDLFEYAFPGVLLAGSPIHSDLPRWTAKMYASSFCGIGFGKVNEPWIRARAGVTKVLGS